MHPGEFHCSYVYKQLAYQTALAALIFCLSGPASALRDEWYLGVGGGSSRLQPDPADQTIGLDEEHAKVGTVFFGRDLDNRSSAQLQLYTLGDAEYSNGQGVSYSAADLSVLYRFYDSRDSKRLGKVEGASVYGRFGIGTIDRDTDLAINSDNPVYFGAGAGLETYFTRHLGMRLEAMYHDTDTASATVSLLARFGVRRFKEQPAQNNQESLAGTEAGHVVNTRESQQSQPSSETQESHEIQQIQESQQTEQTEHNAETTNELAVVNAQDKVVPPVDSDADGVADDLDQCAQSNKDFPVNSIGCSRFGGTNIDITFIALTAELNASAYSALRDIALALGQYPTAKIEIVAHTDNSGSEAGQSDRTRQRLRTIGKYLLSQGVAIEQLSLRSFAAKRPLASNETEVGRQRNNRVEVFETH